MFICSKYLTYVHCDGQTCKENWRVRHLWRLELESRFKGNQGAICKVFSLQKFINFSTKFFSGVGRKNVFWTMKLSSNNFWKQLNESDVKTHLDLFRWKKSTKNGPLLPTYISIYVSTYLPPLPTYLPTYLWWIRHCFLIRDLKKRFLIFFVQINFEFERLTQKNSL